MTHQPLAAATPIEVEDRQIEAWRGRSTVEKAALVAGLTNAAREMAKAGLGRDLAERAGPERESATTRPL